MNKKRLILVGKAASGKDHARKVCEQWLGMNYAISYTTRPPREGEEDGKDYFFIPNRDFNKMINEDKWYEYVVFNGWYYGTTREQMETPGQVFIMTPKGLSHLTPEDRQESLVIYFEIDEDIRRNRMNERVGNADSVERRIEADRIDFADYTDYDEKISDPFFKITNIYDIVSQHMELPNKDKFFVDYDGNLTKSYNLSQN
jgi:guanylate kinase